MERTLIDKIVALASIYAKEHNWTKEYCIERIKFVVYATKEYHAENEVADYLALEDANFLELQDILTPPGRMKIEGIDDK